MLAAAAPTRAAERLHDITTLEDLRGLEPVHLDDDWDVRVGLADGGKDAGPWRVLYCLVTYRKEGAPAKMPTDEIDGHNQLGPLSYSVGVEPRIAEVMGSVLRQLRQENPREYLYAACIPLGGKGSYAIKVMKPDRVALFESVVEVTEPEPSPWFALADPEHARAASSDLVVRIDGFPAHPKFESGDPMLCFDPMGIPLLPSDAGEQVKRADREREEDRGDAERANFLPGAVPLATQWQDLVEGNGPRQARVREGKTYPLKLKIEKNALVISSPAKIFTDLDEKFLVRWWVNAKPILAEGAAVHASGWSRSIRERMEYRDTVRVALRLPEYLGKLEAGDRVRVQVLYCPEGYLQLARGGMVEPLEMETLKQGMASIDAPRPTFPLQTNSASFEVSEEMLKARKKQK